MVLVFAAVVMSAALAANEQHVTVLAYGCDFTSTKTITVFEYNKKLLGGAGRRIQVPVVVTADQGIQFGFTLPPGPFTVGYSVDSQKCGSSTEGLVVLPGHDRHIVVSLWPGIFVRDWHDRKFFAGTIPAVGLAVSVVTSESTDCPTAKSPEYAATIDDGAYYVGHAWGTHAFLKLRSAAFDVLYIALPDALRVKGNDEYVVRDITTEDLRKLTTHDLNQDERCSKLPSGSSTLFDM